VAPTYPIYNITVVPRHMRVLEQMGSKKKFWLENTKTRRKIMVKFTRPTQGEDWSEKVAFEIAQLLCIPAPKVELCLDGTQHGVLCKSFLREQEYLVHGNELLSEEDPNYPPGAMYRSSSHTVAAITRVLTKFEARPSPQRPDWFKAVDVFIGYLMFDALIGNTDRHHQNWGVVSIKLPHGRYRYLAPTYDHASSLGRELTDLKREGRLKNGRSGTIAGYCCKRISGIWADAGTSQLSPLEAFAQSGQYGPDAFRWWQQQLAKVTLGELYDRVVRVPSERLSDTGKRFACELMAHNYSQIQSMRP
jgi:HipA-like C-terminal domain